MAADIDYTRLERSLGLNDCSGIVHFRKTIKRNVYIQMNQNNCLGPASNPTSTIKQGYKNTYIFKILYFCTFSKTKLALKRFFFFLNPFGILLVKIFF